MRYMGGSVYGSHGRRAPRGRGSGYMVESGDPFVIGEGEEGSGGHWEMGGSMEGGGLWGKERLGGGGSLWGQGSAGWRIPAPILG